MGGTFVVTLREGFEAALILGIVYTYLQKIGAERQYHYVTGGGLLGVLASIALGVLVTVLSGPLLDLGPDMIGLGVIFVAVVVLTWHGYWMQQHARAVKGEVQRRIDEAQASHRLWIVGVLAFTGVFREGGDPGLGHLPERATHQPAAVLRDHLGVSPVPGRRHVQYRRRQARGHGLPSADADSVGYVVHPGRSRHRGRIPQRACRLPGEALGSRGRQLSVLPARRRSAPVRTPAFESAVA